MRSNPHGLWETVRNFKHDAGTTSPRKDISGESSQDLDTLLADWLGGAMPVTILDLSGVPSSIVNPLVGAVLRIIYEAMFWARHLSEGGRERPLLVVLEEAHVYLGKEVQGPAGAAVRRIAKEGRKYGIGAMLVSQRPSEIDATILSQCGTMVAMRLANSSDRQQVAAAVSEHLQGLLDMLPILRTGEAIGMALKKYAFIFRSSENGRINSGYLDFKPITPPTDVKFIEIHNSESQFGRTPTDIK